MLGGARIGIDIIHVGAETKNPFEGDRSHLCVVARSPVTQGIQHSLPVLSLPTHAKNSTLTAASSRSQRLRLRSVAVNIIMEGAQEESLELVFGVSCFTKGDPRYPKGQDAHFVCNEQQAMGVADGVGGFSKRGIDAGKYARELMQHAANAVCEQPRGRVCPRNILSKASYHTQAEGGSTACIIALRGRTLLAANIGDSGFIVVRKGKVFYRSPPTVAGFNAPLYLQRGFPRRAQELEVPVEEGDLIILGTDGFFDNLFEAQITGVLTKMEERGLELEDMAALFALCGRKRSLTKTGRTPFAAACRKRGIGYSGGKKDDITVIVARVQVAPIEEENSK